MSATNTTPTTPTTTNTAEKKEVALGGLTEAQIFAKIAAGKINAEQFAEWQRARTLDAIVEHREGAFDRWAAYHPPRPALSIFKCSAENCQGHEVSALAQYTRENISSVSWDVELDHKNDPTCDSGTLKSVTFYDVDASDAGFMEAILTKAFKAAICPTGHCSARVANHKEESGLQGQKYLALYFTKRKAEAEAGTEEGTEARGRRGRNANR